MKALPFRPKSPLWIFLTLSVVYLVSRYLNRPETSTSLGDHQHSRQSRYQPYKSAYPHPHNQTQFSYYHARETARRLMPYSPGMHSWRKSQQDELTRLLGCQQSGGRHRSCTSMDQHLVLLGTVHFSRVLDGIFAKKAAFPAGEAIWADAFLWALNQLEYPYLVVDGVDHNETNTRLGEVYELLGPNVKMVIGDYLSIPQCLKNKACVQSKQKPHGIPHHKLFVFDGFGQDVGHPLGRKWHLTFYPQEEKNFTYLGLTIEHYCHKFGVVPPKERSNKVYILGKDRSYLHPPAPTLYPETMWASITNATGVEFTIGTHQKDRTGVESRSTEPKDQLFDGIVDIGSQTRDKFIYELQHHKAVIGLGWPVQPSTPLEALCVGTPFINPVWRGRRSEPDRSKWHTQHPYLARFDPPYVYNVQDHREDDVRIAIEQLLKTPLEEPFIPDEMKKEVYLDRVNQLIRFDWAKAARPSSSAE
ncbi:hypothetical protein Pst134EB_014485 [Puccinia striiformis f. sp. tritici]|uniref:alpha-1,6-mannosyl-glycoprotein 6-beta-N-acetylglucosaminyltransferase n=1 Tax=Puccinia striiformis f. sp. tritici PST-78 TaxID=1165861 RepID=A0A0L0VWR4_9BASI|nr:hypothetical protein Pst134EB_014477 [Puccinia striiformis f. sp. tritici]KAH9454400.1 hypothetical protein Pst134EB_014485 [Puccinia striiformis f. sp. tritici]KNF03435.1 hypothetical protein PSTG_03376 [Puccinia striiformis f. sp. tritici PST-78]